MKIVLLGPDRIDLLNQLKRGRDYSIVVFSETPHWTRLSCVIWLESSTQSKSVVPPYWPRSTFRQLSGLQ